LPTLPDFPGFSQISAPSPELLELVCYPFELEQCSMFTYLPVQDHPVS